MLPFAAVGSVSATTSTVAASASTLAKTVERSFGSILGELSSGAVDTLGKAEATSIAALQGKASLHGVVDAITQAEQTLQTALAVRDKAVSAWNDISRMSI